MPSRQDLKDAFQELRSKHGVYARMAVQDIRDAQDYNQNKYPNGWVGFEQRDDRSKKSYAGAIPIAGSAQDIATEVFRKYGFQVAPMPGEHNILVRKTPETAVMVVRRVHFDRESKLDSQHLRGKYNDLDKRAFDLPKDITKDEVPIEFRPIIVEMKIFDGDGALKRHTLLGRGKFPRSMIGKSETFETKETAIERAREIIDGYYAGAGEVTVENSDFRESTTYSEQEMKNFFYEKRVREKARDNREKFYDRDADWEDEAWKIVQDVLPEDGDYPSSLQDELVEAAIEEVEE